MTALPPSTIVAVVGAGAMGRGIAQIAAVAGHRVLLHDARPHAAAQAIAEIRSILNRLTTKGVMTAPEAEAVAARLVPAASLADLAPAGLVVEAIVEDLEVKRGLFAELEALTGGEAILATNTSSISITAIGAALKRPERLAGMHFFNPAPLMPLVEIVSGLATAPDVAEALYDTATAWAKVPVHTGSTPGFIVNRVARPYYAEALRLLTERVADVATIDAVCREAGGFRMGPFELMDLIGHDVNFAVTRSVWAAYFHDPRFTPSVIQGELVAGGFLGRKSGRGFYDHRPDADPAAKAPRIDEPAPAPEAITIFGGHPLAEALAARLEERQVPFRPKPACSDDRVAEADGLVAYPSDGRTATRRAADDPAIAPGGVAVVDLALNLRDAPKLAYAVDARGVEAGRGRIAAGLLQAAGYASIAIDDSPGLILTRTVCMLANEAADAVQQGVCTVEAVDTAMRLGTNYPRGPMNWAAHIGFDRVARVLTNLAEHYGEDRYRLSPLLRRRALSGEPVHVH